MVSLGHRQDLAAISEADPCLKKIRRLLEGEKISSDSLTAQDIRESLLYTIAHGDERRFIEIATEIGRRRIGNDVDWCQDDFLIFLLLLGNEKFGRPISYLTKVMDVRRRNTNSVPQKINEVFSSLERQEYGIDGEFGFLKIPFLYLVGKLKINRNDAEKVIKAFDTPYLLDQFSPFFQLLSLKAYDLVLIARKPSIAETTNELIEGFKLHARDLTIRQWMDLLLNLPARLILSIFGISIVIGLLAFFFGLGKEFIDMVLISHP